MVKKTLKHSSSEFLNPNKTLKNLSFITNIKQKKLKRINQQGSGNLKFLFSSGSYYDTKKYEQQLKFDRWFLTKLFISVKLGRTPESLYKLTKSLIKARMYFDKMKLSGTDLLKITATLTINQNSLLPRVRELIEKILNIQKKIDEGVINKSGKSIPIKAKKINKYIKEQDNHRKKLMEITAFTNYNDVNSKCRFNWNYFKEQVKGIFKFGKAINDRDVLCHYGLYRQKEAVFNSFYQRFLKQFKNFTNFFPNSDNLIKDLKILDIDITGDAMLSDYDKTKIPITDITNKLREAYSAAIDQNIEYLDPKFKDKTLGVAEKFNEKFSNLSSDFNALMKYFNDNLKHMKIVLQRNEYFGIHRYWSLMPKDKDMFGRDKKNIKVIGNLDDLAKNPTFVNHFKETLKNMFKDSPELFAPSDTPVNSIIPEIFLSYNKIIANSRFAVAPPPAAPATGPMNNNITLPIMTFNIGGKVSFFTNIKKYLSPDGVNDLQDFKLPVIVCIQEGKLEMAQHNSTFSSGFLQNKYVPVAYSQYQQDKAMVIFIRTDCIEDRLIDPETINSINQTPYFLLDDLPNDMPQLTNEKAFNLVKIVFTNPKTGLLPNADMEKIDSYESKEGIVANVQFVGSSMSDIQNLRSIINYKNIGLRQYQIDKFKDLYKTYISNNLNQQLLFIAGDFGGFDDLFSTKDYRNLANNIAITDVNSYYYKIKKFIEDNFKEKKYTDAEIHSFITKIIINNFGTSINNYNRTRHTHPKIDIPVDFIYYNQTIANLQITGGTYNYPISIDRANPGNLSKLLGPQHAVVNLFFNVPVNILQDYKQSTRIIRERVQAKETQKGKHELVGLYTKDEMRMMVRVMDKLMSNFSFGKKPFLLRDFGCLDMQLNTDYSLRDFSKKAIFYSMPFPAFIEVYLFQKSGFYNTKGGKEYYSENQFSMQETENISFVEKFTLFDKIDSDIPFTLMMIPTNDLKTIADIDYTVDDVRDYNGLTKKYCLEFYREKARPELEKYLSNQLAEFKDNNIIINLLKTDNDGHLEAFKTPVNILKTGTTGTVHTPLDSKIILLLFQYMFIMLRLKYIDVQIQKYQTSVIKKEEKIVEVAKQTEKLIDYTSQKTNAFNIFKNGILYLGGINGIFVQGTYKKTPLLLASPKPYDEVGNPLNEIIDLYDANELPDIEWRDLSKMPGAGSLRYINMYVSSKINGAIKIIATSLKNGVLKIHEQFFNNMKPAKDVMDILNTIVRDSTLTQPDELAMISNLKNKDIPLYTKLKNDFPNYVQYANIIFYKLLNDSYALLYSYEKTNTSSLKSMSKTYADTAKQYFDTYIRKIGSTLTNDLENVVKDIQNISDYLNKRKDMELVTLPPITNYVPDKSSPITNIDPNILLDIGIHAMIYNLESLFKTIKQNGFANGKQFQPKLNALGSYYYYLDKEIISTTKISDEIKNACHLVNNITKFIFNICIYDENNGADKTILLTTFINQITAGINTLKNNKIMYKFDKIINGFICVVLDIVNYFSRDVANNPNILTVNLPNLNNKRFYYYYQNALLENKNLQVKKLIVSSNRDFNIFINKISNNPLFGEFYKSYGEIVTLNKDLYQYNKISLSTEFYSDSFDNKKGYLAIFNNLKNIADSGENIFLLENNMKIDKIKLNEVNTNDNGLITYDRSLKEQIDLNIKYVCDGKTNVTGDIPNLAVNTYLNVAQKRANVLGTHAGFDKYVYEYIFEDVTTFLKRVNRQNIISTFVADIINLNYTGAGVQLAGVNDSYGLGAVINITVERFRLACKTATAYIENKSTYPNNQNIVGGVGSQNIITQDIINIVSNIISNGLPGITPQELLNLSSMICGTALFLIYNQVLTIPAFVMLAGGVAINASTFADQIYEITDKQNNPANAANAIHLYLVNPTLQVNSTNGGVVLNPVLNNLGNLQTAINKPIAVLDELDIKTLINNNNFKATNNPTHRAEFIHTPANKGILQNDDEIGTFRQPGLAVGGKNEFKSYNDFRQQLFSNFMCNQGCLNTGFANMNKLNSYQKILFSAINRVDYLLKDYDQQYTLTKICDLFVNNDLPKITKINNLTEPFLNIKDAVNNLIVTMTTNGNFGNINYQQQLPGGNPGNAEQSQNTLFDKTKIENEETLILRYIYLTVCFFLQIKTDDKTNTNAKKISLYIYFQVMQNDQNSINLQPGINLPARPLYNVPGGPLPPNPPRYINNINYKNNEFSNNYIDYNIFQHVLNDSNTYTEISNLISRYNNNTTYTKLSKDIKKEFTDFIKYYCLCITESESNRLYDEITRSTELNNMNCASGLNNIKITNEDLMKNILLLSCNYYKADNAIKYMKYLITRQGNAVAGNFILDLDVLKDYVTSIELGKIFFNIHDAIEKINAIQAFVNANKARYNASTLYLAINNIYINGQPDNARIQAIEQYINNTTIGNNINGNKTLARYNTEFNIITNIKILVDEILNDYKLPAAGGLQNRKYVDKLFTNVHNNYKSNYFYAPLIVNPQDNFDYYKQKIYNTFFELINHYQSLTLHESIDIDFIKICINLFKNNLKIKLASYNYDLNLEIPELQKIWKKSTTNNLVYDNTRPVNKSNIDRMKNVFYYCNFLINNISTDDTKYFIFINDEIINQFKLINHPATEFNTYRFFPIGVPNIPNNNDINPYSTIVPDNITNYTDNHKYNLLFVYKILKQLYDDIMRFMVESNNIIILSCCNILYCSDTPDVPNLLNIKNAFLTLNKTIIDKFNDASLLTSINSIPELNINITTTIPNKYTILKELYNIKLLDKLKFDNLINQNQNIITNENKFASIINNGDILRDLYKVLVKTVQEYNQKVKQIYDIVHPGGGAAAADLSTQINDSFHIIINRDKMKINSLKYFDGLFDLYIHSMYYMNNYDGNINRIKNMVADIINTPAPRLNQDSQLQKYYHCLNSLILNLAPIDLNIFYFANGFIFNNQPNMIGVSLKDNNLNLNTDFNIYAANPNYFMEYIYLNYNTRNKDDLINYYINTYKKPANNSLSILNKSCILDIDTILLDLDTINEFKVKYETTNLTLLQNMVPHFITALNAAVGGPNLLQGGSRTKKHKLKRSKKHIQTLKRKTKNNKKNTKKSMF